MNYASNLVSKVFLWTLDRSRLAHFVINKVALLSTDDQPAGGQDSNAIMQRKSEKETRPEKEALAFVVLKVTGTASFVKKR